MKKSLFFIFIAVTLVVGQTSCKDGDSRKSMLQAVSGASNELLIILAKDQWDGPMGDTIKDFFAQPQMGLPQGEPMFDLLNLPPSNFERNVKSHRNVLLVSITPKVDSASLEYYDSAWANSQKLFKITAPNVESFYKIFDANKDKMMSVYLKAERDRLIRAYKKVANQKIYDTFKDQFKLLIYFPGDYRINKQTDDFMWISAETTVDGRGVVFFQEPYEDQSQLNYQVILDRVNEELKEYIPASLDSSWMGLDMVTPMSAATYKYDNKYYAILVKGLWTAVNDFMGGPFVLNVVLDEKNNRIIYMMGYVYAPDGKKRNMVRQLESILYSMQIDFPEEEK